MDRFPAELDLAKEAPAHVLLGISQGGLHLASQTLNLRLAPTEDRNSFYAFYAVGGGLAGFVTPILAGPLTGSYLNTLFLASSIISAGLALVWHHRLRPLVGNAFLTKVARGLEV